MSRQLVFQAKSSGALEINVDDEIGFWGIEAKDVIDRIKSSGANSVTFRINSLGGDLDDALQIYNYLKDSSIVVETKVDGIAASAATVIMQAANKGKRKVADSACVMTHEASMVVGGKLSDIESGVAALKTANNSIKNVYMSSGVSSEEVDALLYGGDNWMSAQEAIEAGLADSIYNAPKQARATASRIAATAENVPQEIKDKLKPEEMPDNNKPTLLENIINAITDFGKKSPDEPGLEDFKNELTKAQSDHQKEIQEKESKIQTLEAKVTEFKPTEEKLATVEASLTKEKAEREKAEQELADFKAKQDPGKGNDGDPDTPPATDKRSAREKRFDNIAEGLRNYQR